MKCFNLKHMCIYYISFESKENLQLFRIQQRGTLLDRTSSKKVRKQYRRLDTGMESSCVKDESYMNTEVSEEKQTRRRNLGRPQEGRSGNNRSQRVLHGSRRIRQHLSRNPRLITDFKNCYAYNL